MADCSYSRCIQQRRNIRRELQRWTKNMVHIVGLERIAEELMGRRKWKLYQESMSRNYLQPLNNNIKTKLSEEYQKDQTAEAEARLELKNSDTAQLESVTNGTDGPGDPTTKENAKEENDRRREAEDRLKDWSPEAKCYFCVDGKLDSEHTSHGVLSPRNSDSDTTDSHSDNEIPPSLTASTPAAGLLNNNHNHHRNPAGGMATIESVTSMAALAAVAALSGGPAGGPAAPHLPLYGPGLLPANWYIANVARNFRQAEGTPDAERAGEQPLDLSCSKTGGNNGNSNSPAEGKMAQGVRLPGLDTKHIFNSDFRAKPRMSTVAGRRTYTEDELQAALRDIQSGKLGTRRAAVIYGIPRSTLRNKVYKLALERERESHLNPSTPLKLDEEEAMDDDKELSGAEEEKEVEKALQAPLLSMTDILRFSNIDNAETLKALFQKERDGHEVWTGLEHSALGPYVQNLLLASGGLIATQKYPDSEITPMLPEVVKRMIVQEQLLKEQHKIQPTNNGDVERISRPSPSNSVASRTDKPKSESDMETDESPANVILKIPSFKPTTSKNGCDLFRNESGNVVSPPVTSDSSSPPILPGKGMTLKDVKDVIAQSISQKFQQNLEPAKRPVMEMDFKRGGFTPPLGGISVIKNQQQEITRPYQPPQKPQQTGGTGQPQGGKGTRPKRGKYRNYDRDSLVEAVRAVQRGEMSVHRAGSYYGVPHSTLEYKVKERHLMRPRKRDPKPNPVDEKIASMKQNDIRNAADKLKPVMKPPQKFPPTSPNGMKMPMFDPNMPHLPGYNAPPFPFWTPPGFHHIPLDYGRTPSTSFPPNHPEFFAASQMMQKLQEESSRTHGSPNVTPTLAKSARQMAESLLDGTSTNGSFLDGIIRSSLESGVPGSDDKAKEEKAAGLENLSNKALLDQLCRNSRLTPLPRPSTTESTTNSGDESLKKSPFEDGGRRGSSPGAFDHEMNTIELSNDSNASSDRRNVDEAPKSSPPARIYLKQELAKPENLKPEMLVRFREVLADADRNGVAESVTGSASESDVAQD